jgi:hypothetical protein
MIHASGQKQGQKPLDSQCRRLVSVSHCGGQLNVAHGAGKEARARRALQQHSAAAASPLRPPLALCRSEASNRHGAKQSPWAIQTLRAAKGNRQKRVCVYIEATQGGNVAEDGWAVWREGIKCGEGERGGAYPADQEEKKQTNKHRTTVKIHQPYVTAACKHAKGQPNRMVPLGTNRRASSDGPNP